jgi:hypothetical protein
MLIPMLSPNVKRISCVYYVNISPLATLSFAGFLDALREEKGNHKTNDCLIFAKKRLFFGGVTFCPNKK